MKKTFIFMLAMLAFTVTSCDFKKDKEAAEREARAAAEIDSLRNALNLAENESNDLMNTVEQIQNAFREINEAENIVTVQSSQGEGADKTAIIDNMRLIQEKMTLNRELIANLKEQLRASNNNNNKMKSTLDEMVKNFEAQLAEKTKQIEDLQRQLEQRDIRIAEQDRQITSLNENVNTLARSNEQNAQTIEKNTQTIDQQDKTIHTAYYVFGTKKELREQNILQNGDVLTSGNFNRDYFTRIDYRAKKVIPLYSKSAKVLTNHPAGTYSLDKDANGQYTLRVSDPDRFWSISKYLVVQVK